MKYLLLLGVLLLVAGCTNNLTGESVTLVNGAQSIDEDTQIVKASINPQTGEYIFTPDTIQANKKTVIVNDGLQGCAVAMQQKELGINVNFATQDTYEFTPTTPGKYLVACSMNMWRGYLTIQ